MDARELAIQYAIEDLRTGVYKSQRQAAHAHGVARTTLQERLNGRQGHAVAHQDQQRLHPEQEDFLVDWILSENALARSPSKSRVRETATWILRMMGDRKPLGQLWLSNFLGRHPHVTCALGRSAEALQPVLADRDSVRAFLELSTCTRVELGLRYQDLLGLHSAKVTQKDQERVVIIETTLAVGCKVQCLAVLDGEYLQSTWFPAQSPPEWLYTSSGNGWTAKTIGYEWLRYLFMSGSSPKSGQYQPLFATTKSSLL